MAWGKGKNNNGDDDNVEETKYWRCRFCGAGGWAVAGDEGVAQWVHEAACSQNPNNK